LQAQSTLKETPLHSACSSARKDEDCLRMLNILLETKPIGVASLVDTSRRELVWMVSSHDETAVCLAAKRGFLKSVMYLNLFGHSTEPPEKNDVCQMELECSVRSNNPAILHGMFQKHKSCLQATSSKVIKITKIVDSSDVFLDNSNRCDTKIVVLLCQTFKTLREPSIRTYTTFYLPLLSFDSEYQ
jgi:hypothetical protein